MFSHLHEQALSAAKKFKAAESELLLLLQKIDACKGFTELGYASLFSYVNCGLGLSESCTHALIVVARKAREVPALQLAVAAGEITVSKAKAMTSVITAGNQEQWLEKARMSTTRELEKAVAEERPEAFKRVDIKYKGNSQARLSLTIDEETLQALKRVQELMAQKKGGSIGLEQALKELALSYVKKHDPVEKADRNAQNTFHVEGKSALKHSVHQRDRGQCQFKLPSGKSCGAKQWIHLHHIEPKSRGGADTPENLITLCSTHHRLVHAH
jgi:hypothetical protein